MAGAPTETEFKFALADEAAWQVLREHLGEPFAELQQHNRFYDSADGVLATARLALRLRVEGDAGLVTCKGPATRIGAARRRLEIEAALTPAQTRAALDDPDQLLALELPPLATVRPLLGDRPLLLTAAFDNLRCCYRHRLAGQPRVLELDRTRFASGREDFELELELDAAADAHEIAAVEAALLALLDGLGLPRLPSPPSKLARALALRG